MAKRNQQTARREGAQLDARLNDYSALTRTSAAAKSGRSRMGNWPIYAAAAGSALAMSTNASASIIYCGATTNYCESSNQHPVPTATSQELPLIIPFVGNSHHILLSVGHSSITGVGVVDHASVKGLGIKIFDNSSNAKIFVTGASVGPHLGLSTVPQQQGIVNDVFTAGGSTGNFRSGVPGVAGFSISRLGPLHNQTDYGWIRLVFTANQAGAPVTLTAVDWAFDTTGAAIEAGLVTPEPGTMSLGLLALGAAGVAALRRRRTQTPA